MSQMASTRKTAISKLPKMVPARALTLIPRWFSAAISTVATIMKMTQVVVNGQPNSLWQIEPSR
jgi:hypothetical protein